MQDKGLIAELSRHWVARAGVEDHQRCGFQWLVLFLVLV
jgi:hypothetical protein